MLSCSPRNDAPGSSAMYGMSSRRSISATTSEPHSGAAGRAPATLGMSRLVKAASVGSAPLDRRARGLGDAARELDRRRDQLAERLRGEALRAAEDKASLHLPHESEVRRRVDQPRHDLEVEERGREAALRRE